MQVRSRIYFENLIEDTIVTNFPSTESLLRKIIVQILASSKFVHGTIQGRFRDRYVESGSKSCKGLRPLPPSLWLASSDVSRGATRIRDEDNIRGASRYRRGPKFRYGPTSKPRHPSRRGRTALTWMSPPLSVPPLIGHRSALSSTPARALFVLLFQQREKESATNRMTKRKGIRESVLIPRISRFNREI